MNPVRTKLAREHRTGTVPWSSANGKIPGSLNPTPPSGLSFAVLLVAAGLALQCVGYALGRSGYFDPALALFFAGLLIIFVPSARRLLAEDAGRREQLQVACLLGVALAFSYYLLSPFLYSGYDDLLHEATLWQLAQPRSLVSTNPLLPISPHYPGLELFTLGVRWVTGLPLVLSELATVVVSRLILVLAVFLFTERVTRSTRAAGAAVVVYAASPEFYAFNGGFSYQTLALSLGVGAVALLIVVIDSPPRRHDPRFWLALGCLAGVVVSHHLVSWLTMGLLVVFTVSLRVSGRRRAARTVGAAAAFGLVWASVWTALSAPRLFHYLGPILGGAYDGFAGLLTGSGKTRTLFRGTSGPAAPPWEQVLLLGSALVFVALLAVSIRSVLVHRTIRGGVLRLLPAVVAAGYLAVLASRLSATSEELGGRMSSFVFFGLAVIVGAWFAASQRRLRPAVVLPLAALCFLGSMILGSGPDWSYVPGRFLASADERSIDAGTVAAADWAAGHLPHGATVAADRDDAALMEALGHLAPVTEGDGSVNVGPLYFDRTWNHYDTELVKRARIRYLVVDSRLADGPPAFGVYFEPGETSGPERLSRADLDKFASVRGITQIYSDGPVKIFDLSGILGSAPGPRTTLAASPGFPTGANWVVLGPALLVAAEWAQRRRRNPPSVERLMEGLLASVLIGLTGTALLVWSQVPATPVALELLAGMFAVGISRRFESRTAPGDRVSPAGWAARHRRVLATGILSVGLVAAGTAVSVRSDSAVFGPPTTLWLAMGPGHRVEGAVQVSRGAGARMEVLSRDKVLWVAAVPPARASWSEPLPRWAARSTYRLVLVEHGQVVRQVSA